MLKKNKNIYIYIYFIPHCFYLSNLNSFLSLPSLLCFSISALSSLRTQTPSLLSLPSLVVVFGCDRSLKGVVGRGWVHCLGHWLWLGYGSDVWVVGDGVGQWWLWVVDRRGWVVAVDRRAGMKRVISRGSAAEWGRWSWIGG